MTLDGGPCRYQHPECVTDLARDGRCSRNGRRCGRCRPGWCAVAVVEHAAVERLDLPAGWLLAGAGAAGEGDELDAIVEQQMADGQFEEAEITLGEIGRVREELKNKLNEIYDFRIAYPD